MQSVEFVKSTINLSSRWLYAIFSITWADGGGYNVVFSFASESVSLMKAELSEHKFRIKEG